MSNLNLVAARGLEIGDVVLPVGVWIEGSNWVGRPIQYQGIVAGGEIDPAGTPFPAPEDLMWFTDVETGQPLPMPLNYTMGFPSEDDLTFVIPEKH